MEWDEDFALESGDFEIEEELLPEPKSEVPPLVRSGAVVRSEAVVRSGAVVRKCSGSRT